MLLLSIGLRVTNGGADSAVKLVAGKNYQIIDSIELPPGVDSGEYNPITEEHYVESRGPDAAANTHVISIIDAKHFKHTGDFTLPGRRSEAMAIDRARKKMYVNLADEVGVVDLPTRQLMADAQVAMQIYQVQPCKTDRFHRPSKDHRESRSGSVFRRVRSQSGKPDKRFEIIAVELKV